MDEQAEIPSLTASSHHIDGLSVITNPNPSVTQELANSQPTEEVIAPAQGELKKKEGVLIVDNPYDLPSPLQIPSAYSNLPENVCNGPVNGQSPLSINIPVGYVHYPSPSEIYPACKFKREPTKIVCYRCFRQVVTRVEHKATATTYVIMGILCCTVCPLIFLPLCMKDCKLTTHKCPCCDALLYELAPFI